MPKVAILNTSTSAVEGCVITPARPTPRSIRATSCSSHRRTDMCPACYETDRARTPSSGASDPPRSAPDNGAPVSQKIVAILRYRVAAEAIMKRFVLAGLLATACSLVIGVSAQPAPFTIVLTGQSMIRSDLRTTKPAAIPAIKGLLTGDVVFTNLEGAVALPGETIQEGRGFLPRRQRSMRSPRWDSTCWPCRATTPSISKKRASGIRFVKSAGGTSHMREP